MNTSLMFSLAAHGLLGQGLWVAICFTLVATHLTIIAVTIYLHRCLAHGSLELHPLVSHFLRCWLWLSTGMVSREWVAVHRKHHAHCESAQDPHSPRIYGIRKVLWQGTELYQAAAKDPATVERYGAGTPDDWIERCVYARLTWQGVALMLVLDLVLFGALGATVWAIQMMWIPVGAAGIVNGLGHYFGYRTYDGPHDATNIIPFGVLIGGEELHNNHHTFATSAKLSSRWFEIDIGWCYIRLLRACGLARAIRVAPVPVLAEERSHVDLAMLRAVIANRHEVMAGYAKMLVIACKEEMRPFPALALLWRNPNLLAPSEADALEQSLCSYPTLARMQAMRIELMQIWGDKRASPERLLQRLQGWCEQAEASGIARLRRFATRLRCYT
jgi:stearoyl-CoA desaturase (delta-9 desaturase)